MWKLLFCALVQKYKTKLEYLRLFIIQILIWSNSAEKISHLTDATIRLNRLKFTLINLTSKWCMTDYYKWVHDDSHVWWPSCGRSPLWQYTRVNHMKTLKMFYLVSYWTQKVQNYFIFLCSIVLPPVGPSSSHEYHCWNLKDNRVVVRIFIAILRFSFDSPSYLEWRKLQNIV